MSTEELFVIGFAVLAASANAARANWRIDRLEKRLEKKP